MARNPWDEQDPFGTYQEPVNPMTILEYLKAVGDAGQGIAGGLVRAPHVMAKGIDDIVDMFKGQDTAKDSAVVQGTSILDQLAHKIVPENEVGKVSSEMIGENMLAGAIGRGAIAAPKIMGATAATIAPTVVAEEGERLGLSPEQTLAASLAAGALPTMGMGGKNKMEAIEGWTDAYGNPVNTDDIIQTRIAGVTRDIEPLNRRNEKGYLTSPIASEQVAGNYGPGDVAKGNVSKLTNRLDNPIFKAMDEQRASGGQIEYVDNMFAKPLTWEGMVEDGRPMVLLPADKTSVGLVRKIGGVELKTPIRTEGGPMHSEWQRDWASMEDAARGKQRHANNVADETGLEPRYVYMGMDHEGSNFSTMASEGVLRYLEAVGDLTDEGKKLLDKKMRSLPDVKDNKGIAKDWPGYQSWDQMLEWLTNQDIGGDTTVGNRRKAFMNAIKAKEFQNYGAPDVDDVYAAINEPDISQYGSGYAGFRAADAVYADPYGLEHRPLGHGSYDTRIPLGDVYAMDPNQMVPWNLMFYDMAQARADKAPAQAARSVQTARSGVDYQMPTEEWLNRILQYIQQQGRQQ